MRRTNPSAPPVARASGGDARARAPSCVVRRDFLSFVAPHTSTTRRRVVLVRADPPRARGMTSSTSSSPAVARARRGRPKSSSASSRGIRGGRALERSPPTRARGGIGPSLRDDVAVTFIVDRTLLDDDEEGERAVWACGNVEALGRWDADDPAAALEKVDRDRHACTIRCERAEEIEFKLCAVDDEEGVVRWMAGEGVRFTPPSRCAKCEVRCEWPSDDAQDAGVGGDGDGDAGGG